MKIGGILLESKTVNGKTVTQADSRVYERRSTPQTILAGTEIDATKFSTADIYIENGMKNFYKEIVIGHSYDKNTNATHIYSFPYIALFLDETCKNEYLRKSENSTKPSVIKLRNLLMNQEACEKEIDKMVLQLASLCAITRTMEYRGKLFMSTQKGGDKRLRLYLNISGVREVQVPENNKVTTYLDLTPRYRKLVNLQKTR